MIREFTIKRIIGLILILSIGANGYFYIGDWLQKERAKSFNQGVIYVFQQAEKLGEVSITLDGNTIKLIKE